MDDDDDDDDGSNDGSHDGGDDDDHYHDQYLYTLPGYWFPKFRSRIRLSVRNGFRQTLEFAEAAF